MPTWVISTTIQAGEKGGIMKIIERNQIYMLCTFESHESITGRKQPSTLVQGEFILPLSTGEHIDIELTPHGAYTLGKQLINWAASVDPELTAIS